MPITPGFRPMNYRKNFPQPVSVTIGLLLLYLSMYYNTISSLPLDILVPEELLPPSIDILWTTNLSMDQLAEVLRESDRKWDDPSLIDLLEE